MIKKIFKILKYWLPATLWASVIFTFSSFPTGQASEIHWQDFILKKSAHIFIYAVLTILVFRGLRGYGVNFLDSLKYSILMATIYGISDEFHQSFTPGRDPKVRDILFDILGSFLGVYIIAKIIPRLPKEILRLVERFEITN